MEGDEALALVDRQIAHCERLIDCPGVAGAALAAVSKRGENPLGLSYVRLRWLCEERRPQWARALGTVLETKEAAGEQTQAGYRR
jgi:hypothetical protein